MRRACLPPHTRKRRTASPRRVGRSRAAASPTSAICNRRRIADADGGTARVGLAGTGACGAWRPTLPHSADRVSRRVAAAARGESHHAPPIDDGSRVPCGTPRVGSADRARGALGPTLTQRRSASPRRVGAPARGHRPSPIARSGWMGTRAGGFAGSVRRRVHPTRRPRPGLSSARPRLSSRLPHRRSASRTSPRASRRTAGSRDARHALRPHVHALRHRPANSMPRALRR